MTGFAAALASGYAQTGLNLAVQILMVPLYLSYLGAERFGLLTLYLAGSGYLAVGYLWASGATTRMLGESYAVKDEARFALVYAVSKRVALGYALLAGVVAGSWIAVAAPEQAAMAALFGAYLLATYLFSVDRVALTARGRQAEANWLTMAAQIGFVGLAVPALMADLGLAGVAAALAVGQLIAQALTWACWRRGGIKPGWSATGDRASLLRQMLGRRGAGFILYGVLSLSLQADVLILGWLAPLTAVAAFALVWKVAEAGVQLLWRVPDTLQPFLIHHDARADRASLTQVYGRVLLWSWLAGPLAGLVFALLGPSLISLWVGPEHTPADPLAYWAAGGAVGWLTVARPAIITAFAMVRLAPLLAIMGIELAAKVALMAVLAPASGFAAPLIAINLTHLLGIAWAYQWLGWRLARGRA
jgi:O-antigen/teichoic acid export membrane protein